MEIEKGRLRRAFRGFKDRNSAATALLILMMLGGCSGPSVPPVDVYPPDGRYGVEFSAGLGPGNTVLCRGVLAIDFELDGADLSGTYGPDGPATFACEDGFTTQIAAGTGPLRNIHYTDVGFEFDLSTTDWHVEALGTGPQSFLGEFRVVVPQGSGDTVVTGDVLGLKSRTPP
jgi:hypothetical protein